MFDIEELKKLKQEELDSRVNDTNVYADAKELYIAYYIEVDGIGLAPITFFK